MSEEQGVIRRIAWRELCPWLLLFRTFRLAISLPVLLLATIGALVTPLGWQLGGFLFISPETTDSYFQRVVDENGRWPDLVGQSITIFGASDAMADTPSSSAGPVSSDTVPSSSDSVPSTSDPMFPDRLLGVFSNLDGVYQRFTGPFRRLVDTGAADAATQRMRAAYFLFGGIWNVAVWALLAGAITRIAAVYLGREERVGLRAAVGHAARNYGWYFASPFFPLIGVMLVAVPLVVMGMLLRFSLGVFLASPLWVLMLIGGLVIAILLLGLMLGWPLMWPAISSEEGGDAFEAFSRSYSYTFQRPLHYLFFAGISVLFGGLCWLLVSQFAAAVVNLPLWFASLGAGPDRIELIVNGRGTGLEWLGSGLIRALNGLVLSIAAGFNYSFFFTAATAIYLLLRREYDRTELDEVFVVDAEDQFGMPPLPEQSSE